MAEVAFSPFATILRPRGLFGEMLLQVHPSSGKITKNLQVVWLGETSEHLAAWDVAYLKFANKSAFLKLRKINSRREAEFLSGLTVYLPAFAVATDPWSYLVGFKVYDKNQVRVVGEITNIDRTTPQAKFVIQLGDGRQLLYPAVSELIESIDQSAKIMSLKLLDDLLSL